MSSAEKAGFAAPPSGRPSAEILARGRALSFSAESAPFCADAKISSICEIRTPTAASAAGSKAATAARAK